MTTLVILILIAIWAAVLIYPFVRARTEGGFGDSIGTFRRHLSVLERAAPQSVSAAHRLRASNAPSAFGAIPPYRSSAVGRPRTRSGAPSRRVTSAAAARRRQIQKRRRDVLFTLLAGLLGSLLLGLIPGLSIMLYVCAGIGVLLFAYIALLVRLHNLAVEREMKLAFLPRSPANRAGVGYGPVGYGPVGYGPVGYGPVEYAPVGYGVASDILMRRPAN